MRRAGDDTSLPFDLAYVRTGQRGRTPVLVLPGGPGVASIRMYEPFRASATKHGLDVVMVDHRGVAFSRRDTSGRDLPPESMTLESAVDDLAAVLDAEGIEQVIVSGTSYGTYLAQAFGVRHPQRVAGMVLDSTVLTAEDHHEVRRNARRLLWEGADPATAEVASKIRILVERDGLDPLALGDAARLLYEFGGVALLDRYLEQLVRGQARATQRTIARLMSKEVAEGSPGIMEFDLVGRIAFRELQYHPEPDGLIFDPAPSMEEASHAHPPYAGEPFDLPAALPRFDWLTAVISGGRDLRTPRVVAERVASLLPDGVLVPIAEMGHSALDTHNEILLEVARAVRDGDRERLAELARSGGSEIRRRGASGLLGPILRALLAAEKPVAPLVRAATRR
ncbi:alpha/beta fold hydrolase [Mobilicoccus caccae]|uniref:Alpha/beta hydrolase n=1 Tax=Mobilicoccus caccae TaxID=1859295 RepID=A0ABQ6IL59_9MICO|nr:alpha/beta hydrolase [Mobilicoccus caccae]GMA38085.1 alpha/beta hydrolase [Mobilicoccus caccae]